MKGKHQNVNVQLNALNTISSMCLLWHRVPLRVGMTINVSKKTVCEDCHVTHFCDNVETLTTIKNTVKNTAMYVAQTLAHMAVMKISY